MGSTSTQGEGPDKGAPGVPEDAPDALHRAAGGDSAAADLNGHEERSALDWLLGATQAPEFDVNLEYDTPDGLKPIVFHLKGLDDKKIEEVEERNRTGEGPFAKLNVGAFNAELTAEALMYVLDPKTGRKIDPGSTEFRGDIPSIALALEGRFRYQPGLLEGVAERIREKAGYARGRVGTAKRAVTAAVGGS
jgi:hypothetical protein